MTEIIWTAGAGRELQEGLRRFRSEGFLFGVEGETMQQEGDGEVLGDGAGDAHAALFTLVTSLREWGNGAWSTP